MASLFEQPIKFLKGVGEKRAELFAKLGVNSVGELICYYPRTYEDWSNIVNISDIKPEEVCCIKAVVTAPPSESRVSGGRIITKVRLADDSGVVTATFFNNRYVKNMLVYNCEYLFMGKVNYSMNRAELISPEFVQTNKAKEIRPIYGCTHGLTTRQIENTVINALQLLPEKIKEGIPVDIREKYDLITYDEAIRSVHFPKDMEALLKARKRLIFQELLVLSLGLYSMKNGRRSETAVKIEHSYLDEYKKLLPFTPTEGQQKAMQDCIDDMINSQYPMSRLVQGDVGCGKTAVAAGVSYSVIKNGYQVAFMAPTEILAEQHYNSLTKLFEGTGVNVELLVGGNKVAQKRRINDALATGACDLAVGTHALLSDTVEFRNLGLVITDEQHRFGVAQRNTLVEKGENPHLLIMSATPIPRTLALIVYGDLDISIIDTMPPGRQKIDTFLVNGKKRKGMYGFIKEHLDNGRQCYIVCPAVEENEMFNVAAAEQYAEKIQENEFRDYTVGVLHGKMKPALKEEIMTSFKNGEIQILVATTVVEVGVDVPNATVIVVENAERFGLSQLHQLRGRVGRGSEKSYCILMSDNTNPDTQQRLKTMCVTNNGFEIADTDLKLRGPGDFFGSRQHGLPELKIADLANVDYLKTASHAADEIIKKDPYLQLDEHRMLKAEVKRLFAKIGEGGFN
ncbi:MAG: ATP-dependent DNA helicase RecG [Acutalibacteraceae bacterium]|nr:ATP-dependent DNA helicase RecG [Acutalibacteraceae bacterium]